MIFCYLSNDVIARCVEDKVRAERGIFVRGGEEREGGGGGDAFRRRHPRIISAATDSSPNK